MQRVLRTFNDFFFHGYPLCISLLCIDFGCFYHVGLLNIRSRGLETRNSVLERNSRLRVPGMLVFSSINSWFSFVRCVVVDLHSSHTHGSIWPGNVSHIEILVQTT
jgi:hypothetical protein